MAGPASTHNSRFGASRQPSAAAWPSATLPPVTAGACGESAPAAPALRVGNVRKPAGRYVQCQPIPQRQSARPAPPNQHLGYLQRPQLLLMKSA